MKFLVAIVGLLFIQFLFGQNLYRSPRFNLLRNKIQQSSFSKGEKPTDSILKELNVKFSKTGFGKTAGSSGIVYLTVEYTQSDALKKLETLGGKIQTVTESYANLEFPLNQLNALLNVPHIKRVDVGYKVKPFNSYAVTAAYPEVPHRAGYYGKNVICGIVDTGIDFTHPMFLNPDGTTRILYIWDQTDDSTTGFSPPSGFTYGREYTATDINQDLAAGGNHSVVNQQDLDGHGTHVAGTFAGYDSALVAAQDTSFEGAAIKGNIIFVKTTFYSNAINDGVNYIFQKAQALGMPAVVNLSLGSQIGPHDGTDTYTDQLDQLVGPGKIVVRSAGNDGSDKIHTRGSVVGVNNSYDINYSVPSTSPSGYLYFDIWYDGGDQVRMEIYENGATTANASADYGQVYNSGYYYIDNASSGTDPGNGLNNAFIAILWPYDNSYIRLTLTSDNGDGQSSFHCWISMSTGISAYLNSPSDGYSRGTAYTNNFYLYTLGNGACGDNVISVGAYMSRKTWPTTDGTYIYNSGDSGGIMYFSSQGPTRDGRNKPDCAAGGGMVLSALSGDIATPSGVFGISPSYPQYRWMQGTSMSSSAAAGMIALLMEKNPTWGPSDVLNYIQTYSQGTSGNASTSPKTDPGTWDAAFGYGVIDLTYMVNYHVSTLPVPSTGTYTFTSGSMDIAKATFNSEAMDSVKIELYLDSLPPNMPSGSKALRRFYRITPINSTGVFSVNLDLYYTDQEFTSSGITAAENTLDLYRWNGSYWEQQFASVDVNTNTLSTTNTTQFSIWAISSTEDASLPVELSSFDASIDEDGVILKWNTESEINHLGFEILRSEDGEVYRKIASYQTDSDLKGNGSTNSGKEYHYTDHTVVENNEYWYKLISVSFSGETEEFGPVHILFSKNGTVSNPNAIPSTFYLRTAYPNPFNPVVHIPFGVPQTDRKNRRIRIRVFDVSGRMVKELANKEFMPGNYKMLWDGTGRTGEKLPSGIYFIHMQSQTFNKTIKVMLVK